MNKDYIFYFMFLVVFIFATFNGIMILRSNSFRNPTNNKYVEGIPATLVGIFLVLLGISSIILFLSGFDIFLNL